MGKMANGTARSFMAMGLTFAILAGANPAQAASAAAIAAMPIEQAATELSPNQFVWKDNGSSEPVSIVISLQEQRAFVRNQCCMRLGKLKITLIIDDRFELVGVFINVGMRILEFFGRKTHPVPMSCKRIYAGCFNVGFETGILQLARQLVEIIHQRFATRDHRQSAGILQRAIDNVVNVKFWMQVGIPGFFHVAPVTAHFAAAEADKVSSAPAMLALSL